MTILDQLEQSWKQSESLEVKSAVKRVQREKEEVTTKEPVKEFKKVSLTSFSIATEYSKTYSCGTKLDFYEIRFFNQPK